MKRLFALILVLILSFSVLGCQAQGQAVPETSAPQESSKVPETTKASETTKVPETTKNEQQTAETESEELKANIGGIKLGDSYDKVLEVLGKDFKKTTFDEAPSLGEPFIKMDYSGVLVVVGSQTKTVLEIETTSRDTKNNLGYAVGDLAQSALDAYRTKYTEPKSNQDDKVLVGWFLIKDQKLVIFNFDQTDSLVNGAVKPDSRITRIKFTNFNYMD